jgi:hypothetical protein
VFEGSWDRWLDLARQSADEHVSNIPLDFPHALRVLEYISRAPSQLSTDDVESMAQALGLAHGGAHSTLRVLLHLGVVRVFPGKDASSSVIDWGAGDLVGRAWMALSSTISSAPRRV